MSVTLQHMLAFYEVVCATNGLQDVTHKCLLPPAEVKQCEWNVLHKTLEIKKQGLFILSSLKFYNDYIRDRLKGNKPATQVFETRLRQRKYMHN